MSESIVPEPSFNPSDEVARLKKIAAEKRADWLEYQRIADIFKTAAYDYERQARELENLERDGSGTKTPPQGAVRR